MDCYNVKVIDYLEGQEIRIYSDLINKKALIDNQEENVKPKPKDFKTCREKQITIEDYTEELEKQNKNRVKAHERSMYSSVNRSVNSIYEIARSNKWEYFLTLTFNPDKVDSTDYDCVVKKLSMWINNFKKKYAPNLKYLIVPELHKSGRYHFHGLLADIGNAELIDSGKKDKDNEVIYNLGNYKLGFTTCTRIKDLDRVSKYIGKYITKDLCCVTFGKKRYWNSKNLDKPTVKKYIMSHEEIMDMVDSVSNRITFSKEVNCGLYDMKTTYYQLKN